MSDIKHTPGPWTVRETREVYEDDEVSLGLFVIPRVALNLRHCLRREAKSPSPSTPGTHAATIYANLRIFHLPTRSDTLRQTS
jgi:hypothetical protein